MSQNHEEFSRLATVEELLELVELLRSEQGCPWDRQQTGRSLKPYFLEECYELLEAIEGDRPEKLCEELGDVLLHICFQVSLAREAGLFGLADVVAATRDKMIRRHPHVFADMTFADRTDQLSFWERIKHEERSNSGENEGGQEQSSVLDGLPGNLPPLLKSYRIQGRVSKYRFDWENPLELFGKIEEEQRELRKAMAGEDREAIEEELGDLLFTLVNLARLLNVHPVLALERTNRKFINRFRQLEKILAERGQKLGELSLEELDAVWEEVKGREKGFTGGDGS